MLWTMLRHSSALAVTGPRTFWKWYLPREQNGSAHGYTAEQLGWKTDTAWDYVMYFTFSSKSNFTNALMGIYQIPDP